MTHESIPLFFWLMKVEFEISMENWQIFRHYGKTKNNFEISDVSGAPKWWMQGDERIIIRRHILRKGCFKILYQNYFHTLNHKKISEQYPLTVTYYLFSISQLYMYFQKNNRNPKYDNPQDECNHIFITCFVEGKGSH